MAFFEVKQNVFQQEKALISLDMTKWRGRITMLNSLAWLFLTKLSDPVNGLRVCEEAKELTLNMQSKDLRQNDFIIAANFVLIAVSGA